MSVRAAGALRSNTMLIQKKTTQYLIEQVAAKGK